MQLITYLSVWLGLPQEDAVIRQHWQSALKAGCQEEAREQQPGASCVLPASTPGVASSQRYQAKSWRGAYLLTWQMTLTTGQGKGHQRTNSRSTCRDAWVGKRDFYLPDSFLFVSFCNFVLLLGSETVAIFIDITPGAEGPGALGDSKKKAGLAQLACLANLWNIVIRRGVFACVCWVLYRQKNTVGGVTILWPACTQTLSIKIHLRPD